MFCSLCWWNIYLEKKRNTSWFWYLHVGTIWLDNGGGMDPEAIRRCMSFGFSDKKSKAAIGQCTELVCAFTEFYDYFLPYLLLELWSFQMVMASRPAPWDLGQMLLSSAATWVIGLIMILKLSLTCSSEFKCLQFLYKPCTSEVIATAG